MFTILPTAGILNAAQNHENIVVQAIVKGDSEAALRGTKAWVTAEPNNPIAQSLAKAFTRTLSCGSEARSVRIRDYAAPFSGWIKDLRTKYPNNPNIAMMAVELDCDGLDCIQKNFYKALEMKGSNLDFNFWVELCDYWVGNKLTNRLRADWKNKKTIPTALRLAQRLTCCNDDFCATAKEGQEAQKTLEQVLRLDPTNDSIKEALSWAQARQTKKP